jgi:hypothetical protein
MSIMSINCTGELWISSCLNLLLQADKKIKGVVSKLDCLLACAKFMIFNVPGRPNLFPIQSDAVATKTIVCY